MATVTITITDTEDGIHVGEDFDPPIASEGNVSQAQLAAVIMLGAVRDEAEEEVDLDEYERD